MHDDTQDGLAFAHPITTGADSSLPMARPVSSEYFEELRADRVDPMGLHRFPRNAAWGDLALIVIMILTFEVFVHLIVGMVTGLDMDAPEAESDAMAEKAYRDLFLPLMFLRAIGVSLVVFVVVKWRAQSAASVGLTGHEWVVNSLLGIVATVFAYMVMTAAMIIMWFVSPGSIEGLQENAKQLQALMPPMHPLMFVPLTAAIGFYEELFFRGFMMTRLRRATGSWTAAIVISTIVFTALHAAEQTPQALVMISILSLIFSGLTIWRRSLVPAIIAHMLFNLSQFLLLHATAGEAWT